MEWNDVNVLRLIELYREREILWNCKLKEYKNKNKRHDALLEIAVSFGVSKEEVDKKIRYLLSHFAREVKKENDTNQNGNDNETVRIVHIIVTTNSAKFYQKPKQH
ncbi:hypothetical protein RN001_003525 [Aquatica leii]|uniref:MADF domain-containing protein n=1 Tax=Aquatica leii TaxID=1421715 RepID=A0AAN7Q6E7_9COLE|nr:hypothetical protein RN001_003525 [Aquatica leii]